MEINSKDTIRGTVAFFLLFVFLRGFWLSNQLPLKSWLNLLNWIVSWIVLVIIVFIVLGVICEKVFIPLWNGEKKLFKTFTIFKNNPKNK